jgi:hypothetical protein
MIKHNIREAVKKQYLIKEVERVNISVFLAICRKL